jgi:sensor histidine kinase regulating citrate/malate metabolism
VIFSLRISSALVYEKILLLTTITFRGDYPGISSEQTDIIFEKGFSSKHVDRGQGLYLVKKALQNLNGQITIADSDLGGAFFGLWDRRDFRRC